MTAEKAIIWNGLTTRNMQAARAFYTAVLGWTYSETQLPDGVYTLAHSDGALVGGLLPLADWRDSEDIRAQWMPYFRTADVDGAAAAAASAGGAVDRAPWDIPGFGRMAVIADPHGCVSGIMTPLPQMPMPGDAVQWNELATRDMAASRAFYGAMFGWAFDEVPLPDGVYTIARHGETTVGGFLPANDWPDNETIRSQWMPYFRVADVDGAVSATSASGGRILRAPWDIPGFGRVAVVTDPEGVFFGLMSPPASD